MLWSLDAHKHRKDSQETVEISLSLTLSLWFNLPTNYQSFSSWRNILNWRDTTRLLSWSKSFRLERPWATVQSPTPRLPPPADPLTCDGCVAAGTLFGILAAEALDAVGTFSLRGEGLAGQGGFAARAEETLFVPDLVLVGDPAFSQGLQDRSTDVLLSDVWTQDASEGVFSLVFYR